MSTADPSQGELYGRIRRELGEIHLVDAHEHLPNEEQWLAQPIDFATRGSLLGYALGDLVVAGMPKDVLQLGMKAEEKWQQIRPFWPHVRNMGPGSLARRAFSMFCGVEDLDDSTVPIIDEKINDLRKPGIYRQLFDSYKLTVCLNVLVGGGSASEFFAPLLYTAQYAAIQRRSDVHRLERAANQEIYSLKTFLQALDTVLENCRQRGYVGLKWHLLAYLRDIHYPLEDAHKAEQCLDRILRMPARDGIGSDTAVGFDEMRPFQNFVQNHFVQRAIELDWPVQIHTGILGGSYGAHISHTNPTHLTDLFLRYPQARFDLLHASYPYMRELTALAKLFPNVYINTAWFEILSPQASKQFLREWISSVPINKIFAFGPDQACLLLSCAYAEMVRDNLAEVLSDAAAEGEMSEEDALYVAGRMLRDNPWEYFKLQERWAGSHS